METIQTTISHADRCSLCGQQAELVIKNTMTSFECSACLKAKAEHKMPKFHTHATSTDMVCGACAESLGYGEHRLQCHRAPYCGGSGDPAIVVLPQTQYRVIMEAFMASQPHGNLYVRSAVCAHCGHNNGYVRTALPATVACACCGAQQRATELPQLRQWGVGSGPEQYSGNKLYTYAYAPLGCNAKEALAIALLDEQGKQNERDALCREVADVIRKRESWK